MTVNIFELINRKQLIVNCINKCVICCFGLESCNCCSVFGYSVMSTLLSYFTGTKLNVTKQ